MPKRAVVGGIGVSLSSLWQEVLEGRRRFSALRGGLTFWEAGRSLCGPANGTLLLLRAALGWSVGWAMRRAGLCVLVRASPASVLLWHSPGSVSWLMSPAPAVLLQEPCPLQLPLFSAQV